MRRRAGAILIAVLLMFNILLLPIHMQGYAEAPEPEWDEPPVAELRERAQAPAPSVYELPQGDVSIAGAEGEEFAYSDFTPNGAVTIPSSYSLVSEGRVSPVKDQGQTDTCWAFAACAALESNLITRSYATAASVDLSEKHLAYYTYSGTSDELGGTAGDGIYPTDPADNYITTGGHQWLPMVRMAGWFGVVDETEGWTLYPYEYEKNGQYYLFSDYEKYYNFRYRGASEYDDVSPVTQGEQSFSAADGYAIDDYHLKNAYRISLRDVDVIKELIRTNGAGVLSLVMSSSDPGCYNSTTAAHYQSSMINYFTNHDVAVVGWDDNYSRTNFATVPPCDGAWLCKNSYGTSFGNNGYFWLSYADWSVTGYCEDEMYDSGNTHTCTEACDAELVFGDVFFYEAAPVGEDSHIYQYDGGGSTGRRRIIGVPLDQAAVFTCAGDGSGDVDKEYLTSVGFYTEQTNVEYSVQVYKNVTLAQIDPDPTNGTPALSQPVTGTAALVGYHSVDLGELVLLEEGEQFSVVVSMSHGEDGVWFSMDFDSGMGWVNFDTAAASRQTFYSVGHGWIDMKSSYDPNAKDYALRLKAKTIDYYDPNPATGVSFESESMTIEVGGTEQLSVILTPADATTPLRWTVTDAQGQPTNAVSVNGTGGSVGVTATVPGQYTVTVTVGGFSDSIALNVTQAATGLSLTPAQAVIESGGTLTLSAKVLPESNTEGLTVSWQSSDPAAVSVNNGVLTASPDPAMQGRQVTITASVTAAAGTFTQTCVVTIRKPATELTISQTAVTMLEGETVQLTAEILPADNTDGLAVTWRSSDEKVVVVTADGLIKTRALGEAVITAQAGELTKTCRVEVLPTYTLTALGGSARLIEPYGLRFGIQLNKDNYYSKYKSEIVCYGTLLIPANVLGDAELTVDTPSVRNVVADKFISEDNAALVYTGVLVNIPKSSFGREIAGRGYIQYRDVNGNLKYYYSNTIVRTYKGVCEVEYNKYVGKTNLTASQQAIFKNVAAIIAAMTE